MTAEPAAVRMGDEIDYYHGGGREGAGPGAGTGSRRGHNQDPLQDPWVRNSLDIWKKNFFETGSVALTLPVSV